MACCSSQQACKTETFGVEMTEDTAPKIVDTAKFLNWSWWFCLTPYCHAEVFARPGLHYSVIRYVLVGNAAYFLAHAGYTWGVAYPGYLLPFNTSVVQQLLRWMSRLMTFVVSTYIIRVIQQFYFTAKKKAGAIRDNSSKIVDTITLAFLPDPDNPARSDEFLTKLHGAITAIAYYGFAKAQKNTRYKVKHKKMVQMFRDRGLDGKYLCSLEKKETIDVVRLAILKTIDEERVGASNWDDDEIKDKNDNNNNNNTANGGLMRRLNADDWVMLKRDMEGLSSAAMSLCSCTKSNKLPFGYQQLVNWGTRVTTWFYVIYLYLYSCELAIESGSAAPFTCWSTLYSSPDVDPNDQDYVVCSTKIYIFSNVAIGIMLYFILGLLDMYHNIDHMWENGLSASHYLNEVEWRCKPLLPNSSRRDNVTKQVKNLDAIKFIPHGDLDEAEGDDDDDDEEHAALQPPPDMRLSF